MYIFCSLLHLVKYEFFKLQLVLIQPLLWTNALIGVLPKTRICCSQISSELWVLVTSRLLILVIPETLVIFFSLCGRWFTEKWTWNSYYNTYLLTLPAFAYKSPALSLNRWQIFSSCELCSGTTWCWKLLRQVRQALQAKCVCSHQLEAQRNHKVTSFTFSVASTSPAPILLQLTAETDLVPKGRTLPTNTRMKLRCN